MMLGIGKSSASTRWATSALSTQTLKLGGLEFDPTTLNSTAITLNVRGKADTCPWRPRDRRIGGLSWRRRRVRPDDGAQTPRLPACVAWPLAARVAHARPCRDADWPRWPPHEGAWTALSRSLACAAGSCARPASAMPGGAPQGLGTLYSRRASPGGWGPTPYFSCPFCFKGWLERHSTFPCAGAQTICGLAVVHGGVRGVAFQGCTAVGSRLGAANSAHLVARPALRRVGSTHRSEVHRLAADARDEVGYDSGMGLALDNDALEVLVAARAHEIQFHAVHAGTVQTYSLSEN